MIELDTALFHRFLANLKKNGVETHAVTVYQHGRRRFSKAFAPYSRKALHPVYSVTKSFTSIAFGYLWKEKKISLDTPWLSFFPEYAEKADPMFRKVTLRHLLTMTMGHDSEAMVKAGDDWILNVVQKPFAYEPGTHFFYNSMCSYLIGRLVEKETHQQLSAWLQPRLFRPLGIQDYWWEKDQSGHELGGYGLHLKTEDLAKFGECVRCQGKWEGRQVIPEEWLRLAVNRQVENAYAYPPERSENRQGYGFYFWICTHGAFRCSGLHGQLCLVQPENELVIAMSNATTGSQVILNSLFAAMYGKEKGNPKPVFRIPCPQGAAHSPYEKRWLGKEYNGLPGPGSLDKFKLQSGRKGLRLSLVQKGKKYVFTAGHRQWLEGKNTIRGYSSFFSAEAMDAHVPRAYRLAMFASYAWLTPTSLAVQAKALDCSSTYTWLIKFDHDYVVVDYQVTALYTMFPMYEAVLKK
jgi:CubicO group peptidase (beta-lactamase class C family)